MSKNVFVVPENLRRSGHIVRLLVYSKGLAVRHLQKHLLKNDKQRMIFILIETFSFYRTICPFE
jgi:hypothetical protein